jgi:membrane protein required for colicin V production
MVIDLLFLCVLALALFKGLQRGLIVAVFSLIAFIVGLAAALKLSAVAAVYLQEHWDVSTKWAPVLSFALVFLVVVLLIRIAANLIETTVEIALLGWVNKLGGVLLYMVLYTIIFSILLFFAVQLKMVSDETLQASVCYAFIEPWGPVVMNGFGRLIPVFRDLFTELEDFFGNLSQKID